MKTHNKADASDGLQPRVIRNVMYGDGSTLFWTGYCLAHGDKLKHPSNLSLFSSPCRKKRYDLRLVIV